MCGPFVPLFVKSSHALTVRNTTLAMPHYSRPYTEGNVIFPFYNKYEVRHRHSRSTSFGRAAASGTHSKTAMHNAFAACTVRKLCKFRLQHGRKMSLSYKSVFAKMCCHKSKGPRSCWNWIDCSTITSDAEGQNKLRSKSRCFEWVSDMRHSRK